uniref:Signal peptidase complex subunit 1 n=1 Tax=Haemonchus placei TaxID=6290 RepID=A0A0N4WKD8_HAEPC
LSVEKYFCLFCQTSCQPGFQVIIVLAGIIGFAIGFATQQLSHAIYTVLAGAALSALIILPPWPFLFRKNPIAVSRNIPAVEGV